MNNSPRPKSVALVFLLGAFVAGSAIGYAANRTLTTARSRPTLNQTALRDQLQAKLKLSPAQRAFVDSAYDWRQARRRELEVPIRPALDSFNLRIRPGLDSIYERIKPGLDSLFEATHDRVLTVLDSSQRKTYLQMIEESKGKGGPGRIMSGEKR